MTKTVDPIDLLDTMLTEATGRGLLHRHVEDGALDGRLVRVDGRELVNFGSCSYLGLEVDGRLKAGTIAAVTRYGTQFSSSRTYLSAPPYAELESALEAIFGAPTVIAPTTGLAHLAALPVLVGERDAVILDQQVHQTVHLAVNQLRSQKVHVELIRHSRMDDLAAKLEVLKDRHRHIWYLADGVYSMHGDFAPFADLAALLARYPQLHLYVDDAHGMSWVGRNGRGLALTRLPLRDRMVVATSLNKSFGAAGGAVILPDRETWRRVRTCGGPLIFSGPIQPPMLGAAIASARIHLGDELPLLQARLGALIDRTHDALVDAGLPVLSDAEAPVHFVAMGLPRVAYAMAERLKADGYYTNVAMFPAVPMKRAGIRFTSTVHQRPEDVDGLVASMARHFPAVLAQEETSHEALRKLFRLGAVPAPAPGRTPASAPTPPAAAPAALRLECHASIEALDRAEWDRLLGGEGTFTWEGLRCLEEAFSGNEEPENNWRFRYYVVRDAAGRPVLATFFTDALWKDDMLAPAEVSRVCEARREDDPYFLTSQMFAMGSLLTDGLHLHLDRTADWRGAMKLLLTEVAEQQERFGATGVALRDLAGDDPEMEAFLREQGFLRVAEMEALELEVDWADDAEYLAKLSQKARKHQRLKVLPFDGCYDVEILGVHGRRPTPEETAHFHALYANVKRKNLGLNTFELPAKLFDVLAASPAWELVALTLKPEHGGTPGALPVGVALSFVGNPGTYVPLIFGLDYGFVESHGAYRQLFRQMIRRGERHGARRILCGMEATFEKTRFGAKVDRRAVYYQTTEHFQLDVLSQLKAEASAPSR